jgi:plasmid stabilization system protein ParE
MSFVVKRPPPVEDDLLAAAIWYDEQMPGLGDEFLDEAEAAIATLTVNALIYAVRFDDVRCLRLRRFHPYGIFYTVRGRDIIVLAIHHGARDPDGLSARSRKFT